MAFDRTKLDSETAELVKEVEGIGLEVTDVVFPTPESAARLYISMNGMPMAQARYELEALHYDVGQNLSQGGLCVYVAKRKQKRGGWL